MRTKKVYSGFGLKWVLGMLIIGLGIATACQNQSRGFVLPEGDVEQGKQAFVDLQCNDCHSIADIEWKGDEKNGGPHLRLGGQVTSLKTYGELVTSVINPSHKISRNFHRKQQMTTEEGKSLMEMNYNEVMTVQELVDIVTFLQSEYKLMEPSNPYVYY